MKRRDCELCSSSVKEMERGSRLFKQCSNEDCAEEYFIEKGTCRRCEEGFMILRKNKERTSRFFGCSNYPSCRNIEEFVTSKKRFLNIIKKVKVWFKW